MPDADTNFDKAFTRLIGNEGGFQCNPRDRGNWTTGVVGQGELKGTKFGIASHKYPTLDIKNLTLEQARAIYHRDYWSPVRADELPFNIAFEVFDAAVNHGPERATLLLQQACRISEDGDMGPITLSTAQAAEPLRLEMRFNGARIRYFTSLSSWETFNKGWMLRIAANLEN